MKTLRIAVVVSGLVAVVPASAQDAGYKPPQVQNNGAAANSGGGNQGSSGSASDVKAAGLINTMDQLDSSMTLQADDRLSFRILEDRNEAITLRVQDDGNIQAPNVGLVRAAGRNCREVALSIKSALEKSYYQKATVIIALDMRPKNPTGPGGGGVFSENVDTITLFGQVARQGKYELPRDADVTISQAILMAGGPAAFANMRKVRIIRKIPNRGSRTIEVDVESIMTRGRLERDIMMRKNDVLIVPEKVVNF